MPCSPMAGLMATKGKITAGGSFFGAGLPLCFFEAGFSCSAAGGGRPFLSKFLMAGRLFSGDVLGPVKRQVPSPVEGKTEREKARERLDAQKTLAFFKNIQYDGCAEQRNSHDGGSLYTTPCGKLPQQSEVLHELPKVNAILLADQHLGTKRYC